jgi:hypothetical protein
MFAQLEGIIKEHENEITRLKAEVERLRKALEDVLPLAESYLNMMPDRHGIHIPKLERARAALTPSQEPSDINMPIIDWPPKEKTNDR